MEHHHAATTLTDDAEAGHTACRWCIGRRTALMGMGAVGVAGLLAACGGSDDSGASGTPSTAGSTEPESEPSTTEPATPTEEPSAPAEPSTPAETGSGAEPLAATADIPVGGGVILNGPGVVVTQPTAGTFVAFSSTCTHQGCAVTEVGDGLITCTCHGSQYSADGSVQMGPATQPLAPVAIVVEGDQILPA